jgi:O-antigen ligase
VHLRAIDGREVLTAAAAAIATALMIIVAGRKVSPTLALLAPLGIALVVIVLMRPVLAVGIALVVPILLEGESFGLFTSLAHVYDPIYKHLTVVDALAVLAVASVALEMIRDRRPLHYPRTLRFPDILLVLGMLAGIAVGKSGGTALKSLVLAENLIAWLLVMPLAVANLKVEPRQLQKLLLWLFGLAVFKALVGLVEVGAHKGLSIEGNANLTYYEPTANYVVMVALLAVTTAVVARLRPPLWMLLSTPLLIGSLVLSYRRSFWIAAALGVMLVVLLALSPVGRRLLVPTALFVAAGIWLLGSINFQSQNPIVKRAASLSPTSLSSNAEDRYRLDERANVIAELERKPITGLGILVPWEATARPLPVEHENGREYVHFAAIWWWMRMGILGLLAYIALLIAAARLSWRVWRERREPIFRVFGLASLCGVAGLLVAETTATFTGVELRFTMVFAIQLGLLALIASLPRAEQPERLEAGELAPARA